MIRDVVFDLGNVIITFEPHKFLDRVLNDPKKKEAVMDVFFPELWDQYDRGVYTIEQMVQFGTEKYPQNEDAFRAMMTQWPQQLVPLEASFELVRWLKDNGYRVFVLSNLSEQGYDALKNQFDLIPFLDGGVYSYEHQIIKPDPRIYQILMEQYDIDPTQALFVDDRIENVEAAKQLGFTTIHCSDYHQMPQWVKEKLNEV